MASNRKQSAIRRGLRHHLALVIAIKIMALLIIWALFFRPALRIEVDGDSAAQQLLGELSATTVGSSTANTER